MLSESCTCVFNCTIYNNYVFINQFILATCTCKPSLFACHNFIILTLLAMQYIAKNIAT